MGLFDLFRRKPKSVLDALHSLPEFQKQKALFDAMSAMCEDGVDADEMPNSTGQYGLIPTNPIPCKTVFGSTAYLGRLRAADGTKVIHERLGSIQSSVSPHPIDIYQVTHSAGRKLATLYISPYQKRNSGMAPRGFMLAENSGGQVAPVREVVTEPDGTLKYYSCGVLHRDDGPAVIEAYPDYNGQERHRSWYRFGVLDREDGPAVVGGRTANGQYEWWRAGIRHRDDGPAVIELIESYEFGRGPVYEWWRNGIRHKVQDGDGIVYYFKGDDVLTELPDGCRIIERDGDQRFEDADGKDLGEAPPLEAYEGYLEDYECAHYLYAEPEKTFDTYNPEN
jgi:hypothetical protein